MTPSRLAAAAALSIPALLATTSVGLAQREDDYKAAATCTTKHTDTRAYGKIRTTVKKIDRPGGKNRGTAAAFVPVRGAKVITKLIDLYAGDGDGVVGRARKSDRTNEDGVAKTRHRVSRIGNYTVRVKVKVDGDVVARDRIDWGYQNRDDGPCDHPFDV